MSFKLIINFLTNWLRLVKYLYQENRISWSILASRTTNCKIDKCVKLNENYTLNDVNIGFGTYIAPNALISLTTIGKFCSIGPNVVCGYGIHPLNGISTSPIFYSTRSQAGFTYSTVNKIEERKSIMIGNDVFIGANVTILDGVNIGDGAVIGAGAVVSKNIPPYAIAIGCPIKIVKFRFSKETIELLLKSKWWDGNEDTIKKVERDFFNINNFLEEIERHYE